MTDDDKMAGFSAKLEREMRFTRSLVLLCTAAILGTLLLNLTMMSGQIPDLIYLKMMGEFGPINLRLAQIQKSLDTGKPSPGGSAAPAAEDKK